MVHVLTKMESAHKFHITYLESQYSRRVLSCMYWGAGNRGGSPGWYKVEIPKADRLNFEKNATIVEIVNGMIPGAFVLLRQSAFTTWSSNMVRKFKPCGPKEHGWSMWYDYRMVFWQEHEVRNQ